jgi:hypothetical protein
LEFEKIKIKFENDAAFDWALNKPTTSRSIWNQRNRSSYPSRFNSWFFLPIQLNKIYFSWTQWCPAIAHGSPPALQISFPDEFQRSIDTITCSIPSSQLDFSPQEIDHGVISAGGEVGSIEYQPNGSNDDKELVPEEQMAVFVKLTAKIK